VWLIAAWATGLWLIDPLAMIFGFLIPAAAQITVTNLSTILGHGSGYRNFDTKDKSTNSALLAAITWGEGWHNNHHAKPRRWFFGVKWWEIDTAGLIIAGMIALHVIKRRSISET
jgi:stearoyl-CoA desaturase (delta-9 desaturase)